MVSEQSGCSCQISPGSFSRRDTGLAPPHRVLTLGQWAGPSANLLSRSMGIIHSGDPTVQYQDAIPRNTQKTEFGKMLTVGGRAPGAGPSHSGGRPGVLDSRGFGGPCSHMAFPGEREAPCDYSPSDGCAEQKENTTGPKMEI